MPIFAVFLDQAVFVNGIVMGATYALLGIGLVLIYRASGVIHFGYGETGMFGALLLAKLVLDEDVSWWVAFPLVLAVGAVVGALWERLVIRRLQDQSKVVLLVATIGIAQVMLAAQFLLPSIVHRAPFPVPFQANVRLLGFTLGGDALTVLTIVPLTALALGWMMNRTIWGLGIRAAAENNDAARLAAVPVRRLSTAVWALSGALSTLTFVLILPVRGFIIGANSQAIGPTLLLRALAVGLVGRMVSLPLAVVGGVVWGLAESIMLANVSSPGIVDMFVFLGVLGLLLLRGAHAGSTPEGALVPRSRPSTEQTRRLSSLVFAVAVVVGLVLPFVFASPGRQFTLARVLVLAVIGISVTIITGWAGQLSLAQFAFVGVGAMTTAGLTGRGMPFGWAVLYATALSALVAGLIGFPALRIRGLFLAVATLAFSVGARGWLFDQSAFRSGGSTVIVERPQWGPIDFGDQRTYYYLCLLALVVVVVLAQRIPRTGTGRAMIAVRDNEAAAAAASLPVARTKLMAFVLSGLVAGFGGALLAGLEVNLSATDYGPEQSLAILTMVVIGGVSSVAGAIAGAVYIVGVPALFGSSVTATLLTSGIGVLALLLVLRGGIADGVARLRRTGPRTDEAAVTERAPRTAALGPRALQADALVVPLRCQGVNVTFGGVVANRDIDLTVARGEIVGLIGTNGAGKSTLMNAISGFTETASGSIEIFGEDVTTWAPHERAALGVGRVFQDARLFPELTVEECVLVALEARRRSEVIPDLLSLPPARRAARARQAMAADVIDFTGLGSYRHSLVKELSTGTRRILELGCLVAGGGQLLLLDEPTGGVAQREVEAFGVVIAQLREDLAATIVLIEHDMPLVMSLSDRVVCLSAGEVIADGAPEDVRNDAAVIAAYLGTDERAINRSDATRGVAG